MVPPGGALLQVDGRPVPVQIEPNPGDRGLSVQGEGWELSLEGLGRGGRPLELGPQGALVLDTGRQTALSGSGFAPGSEVGVFLDPPVNPSARAVGTASAVELGDLTVSPSGDFDGAVNLPRTVPPGRHMLQIVGTGARGDQRALSLGILTQAWIELVPGRRIDAGRHDRVTATGKSGGLPAGTTLTAWVRVSGQENFRRGDSAITVRRDGTFTWARRVADTKRITLYVSFGRTDSNSVTWAPRP